MQSENIFVEGLDTDTDPLFHSNKRLFDNLNCRQADLDGRGYVNQPIIGNAYDPAQDLGFTLTADFVPIAKAVFQGVAFIFSFNQQTGFCEVGTYPSPKLTGAGGYDKVYRPLQNWIVANNPYLVAWTARQPPNGFDWGSAGHLAALQPLRADFNTKLFGWSCGMKVMIEPRQDYDGSINLYFCDWQHPDRVINCGFNIETGVYNARTYFDKSFEQALNQFNETLWPIELFDTDEDTCPVEIRNNGSFKCGNYHLYFRYADENFNYTSFVGHSEAILIVPTDDETTWAQTIQGGPSTMETNKSIRMRFNAPKLDTSYRYVQIAYVQNLENGGFNVKLIDRHFEIFDLLSNIGVTDYVEITNNEDLLQLTIADVIKSKRRDDISRDAEVHDNRLWHGNTKTDELYNPGLRDFALSITTSVVEDLAWEHPIQFDICTPAQVAYKNYKNVYLYVGFFRKEWYPFNVQYLLTSGKWTDGFPTKGHDFYKNTDNDLGLVRFPHYGVSPPVDGAGLLKPIGVKFTVNGVNLTPWMKANVVGFRIVRGDRLENLVYQGLSTYVFKSYGQDYHNTKGNYVIKDVCDPTTALTANSELRPRRWGQIAADEKLQFYYATTRLAPSINLLNVDFLEATTGNLPLVLSFDPNDDKALDSTNWHLFTVDTKIAAIFPWIYILKDSCSGSLPKMNSNGHGYRLLADDNGGFVTPGGFDWRGISAVIPSLEQGKYAMFVPDYCMKKIFTDREYFIDCIADWHMDIKSQTVAGGSSLKSVRLKEQQAINDNAFGKNYSNQIYADRGLNIKAFFWDTKDYRYQNLGYYRKALTYGIPQWQTNANHQFSSYFLEGTGEDYAAGEQTDLTDGSASDQNDSFNNAIAKRGQNFSDLIFYYMQSHNKSEKFQITIKNSEFGTAAYLGLDFTPLGEVDKPYGWYYKILNVYRRDPETDDQKGFISKNYNYFPIGSFIYLKDSFPNNMAGGPVNEIAEFKRYQGDCFLQKTYLKTMANPYYNVNKKDDDHLKGYTGAGQTRFTFGNIVGMITENATNVGVRYEKPNGTSEEDKESFYPLINAGDPHEYAGENKAKESYAYNSGYSKVLNHKVCSGYDNQMPFRARFFPTRITYSNEHIIGELQDGWRLSELTNHKDYENINGGIVRLAAGKGKFYSIYEHGVKLHFVNERAVQSSATEGDIVLGTQSDVISAKAYNIDEEIGAQQMDAVDFSDDAIYGLDMTKRSIWKIPFGSAQLEQISLTKQVNARLTEMITSVVGDSHTDITVVYPDDAICSKGVVVMFDRSYNDVYFGLAPNLQDLSTNQCLIFNEKQQRFCGRTSWCPPFYVTINDDFYVVNPLIKQRFYKSDISVFNGVSNYATFFDVVHPTEYEVIANGEKYSSITKVFDALRIIGNYVSPIAIEYRTDYQSGAHNPFDTIATPRYIKPAYREDAWRFSIKRCDAVNDSHYLVGSHYRGKYLKVRVKYLTNLGIFAKSLASFWRISKH